MDIQAIGSRAFTVYIAREELERRHLDPEDITVGEARDIVSSVLECDALGAVKLELYPGRHELLIFVKREPEFYSFPDLESLLLAVGACGDEIAASLFWYDGAYILAVWSGDARRACLSEFGDALDLPAGFLLHLREHARVLREGDAVEVLRRAFLPGRA